MTGYTRRSVLAAVGAATVGGTAVQLATGPDERAERRRAAATTPSVLTARDAATTFPLVTYRRHGGERHVTMPVNVRVRLTDVAAGPTDVERVFRRAPTWSRLVHDFDADWPTDSPPSPTTWSAAERRMVPAAVSYRTPLDPFGDHIDLHVLLWPVRADGDVVGVAAQAHVDVGTLAAHVGAEYAAATAAVADLFAAAGWRVDDGAFDYGVAEATRDRWGPTGDLVVRPRTE